MASAAAAGVPRTEHGRRRPPTGDAVSAGENAPSAEKARWVCERLDAAYGILTWRSHGEPLGTLVMTILSQNTSDTNSERAFDSLRRRFPTWDAVRDAPVADIADAIRCGGLADAKAPRIQAVLREIHRRNHGAAPIDLDFLRDLPTPAAKEYLNSFHGVGPKTTACVLMFSLGRPVLPVDTHVFRVSHRLGLIPQRLGEAKAHDALQAMLPDDRVYPFHVHMIRHGRRVCTAQRPRCGACVLRERCHFFRGSAVATDGGAVPSPSRNPSGRAESLHGLRPEAPTFGGGEAAGTPEP
jgi:endonuclease-3